MSEETNKNLPSCWRLGVDGGQRAKTADWSDAAITAPIWVHENAIDEHVEAWLRDAGQVPEHMIDALLAETSRPRWEREGDHALLILRGVNLMTDADPEDMITLRIWMGPQGVVTMCRRPLMALQDIQRRCDAKRGPRTLGDWLVEMVDGLTERMGPVIDEMGEALDEIELDEMGDLDSKILAPLNVMRNRAVILKRFIGPQLTALTRLISSPPSWLDQRDLTRLRNVIDAVTRYVEELDSLRERAAIVRDAVMQQLNERMNRTMYLLSIVAAVFLPLGFITGLLGINVGGMPGVESAIAFWSVCIGMSVLVVIEVWLLRRYRLM